MAAMDFETAVTGTKGGQDRVPLVAKMGSKRG